jgi:hypothetical protein
MDNWYRLLTAALTKDKEEMVKQSLRLRYLTGDEEEVSNNRLWDLTALRI